MSIGWLTGSYYRTNFVFVKHTLLHISGSWPITVRLVHSWADEWHDSHRWENDFFYLFDMTNSCVTWLIHLCDMTHSYVTWLIHEWHDSPTGTAWIRCCSVILCVVCCSVLQCVAALSEWIMSSIRHASEWVMSHVGESCHTNEWVMSFIRHASEWVMSSINTQHHVTHMNGSCHI